jgi:hypothetical protein
MRWHGEKEDHVDERHARLGWHRSTRCSSGGCIELARDGEEFLVRDSKVDDGPILSFSRLAWGEFVAAVNEGDLSAE